MSSTTAPVGAASPTPKRPKARHGPYDKPDSILLTGDRQARKRKSITWQPDEKLKQFHYFEHIADERINVTRINAAADNQNDPNASAVGSSLTAASNDSKSTASAAGKISNASVDPIRRSYGGIGSSSGSGVGAGGKNESDKNLEYLAPWRPLVLIDFSSELPSPGWNSLERSAQAERESYVLGAIDLPGQPSTLDEPDNHQQSTSLASGTTTVTTATAARVGGTVANSGGTASSASNNNNETVSGSSSGCKEEREAEIEIPLNSPDGVFVEYQNMYNSEFINGLQTPTNNPQPIVQNIAPFCSQQQSQQLLSNQFQQQLIPFQNLGAQFRPQQQQAHFPFHQQPILLPFANQQNLQQQQQMPQLQQPQQQQQISLFQPSTLSGPLMPWTSYPFNTISENSHAHLFRGPAT